MSSWADASDSSDSKSDGAPGLEVELDVPREATAEAKRTAQENLEQSSGWLLELLKQDAGAEVLREHGLLDEQGNATSIGSLLHAGGLCRPCRFTKKNACANGVLCFFCHVDHKRPTKSAQKKGSRPHKHKREQHREFVRKLEEELEADPETFDLDSVVVPASIASEAEAEKLLQKLRARTAELRQVRAGATPGTEVLPSP